MSVGPHDLQMFGLIKHAVGIIICVFPLPTEHNQTSPSNYTLLFTELPHERVLLYQHEMSSIQQSERLISTKHAFCMNIEVKIK